MEGGITMDELNKKLGSSLFTIKRDGKISTAKTIMLPKSCHPTLMRYNGALVKKIEAFSKTRINFPSLRDKKNEIEVVGKLNDVKSVLSLFYCIVFGSPELLPNGIPAKISVSEADIESIVDQFCTTVSVEAKCSPEDNEEDHQHEEEDNDYFDDSDEIEEDDDEDDDDDDNLTDDDDINLESDDDLYDDDDITDDSDLQDDGDCDSCSSGDDDGQCMGAHFQLKIAELINKQFSVSKDELKQHIDPFSVPLSKAEKEFGKKAARMAAQNTTISEKLAKKSQPSNDLRKSLQKSFEQILGAASSSDAAKPSQGVNSKSRKVSEAKSVKKEARKHSKDIAQIISKAILTKSEFDKGSKDNSARNSSQGDSKRSVDKTANAEPSGESERKKKKLRKRTDTVSSCQSDPSMDTAYLENSQVSNREEELPQDFLKLGSMDLLSGNPSKAIQNLKLAKDGSKNASQVPHSSAMDSVIFSYTLCSAYIKSGTYDHLVLAINELSSIPSNMISRLPAIKFLIASACHKLNRFKIAEEKLEELTSVLEKEIVTLESFFYPGTNIIIPETELETLKAESKKLESDCRLTQHNAVAVCRFEKCSELSTHIYPSKYIYSNDPDFSGYIVVICHEKCDIEYHVNCWKAFKESKQLGLTGKVTDKEFLGQPCPTMDCVLSDGSPSPIIKINLYDSKGSIKHSDAMDTSKLKLDAAKRKEKEKLEKEREREKQEKEKKEKVKSGEKAAALKRNTADEANKAKTKSTSIKKPAAIEKKQVAAKNYQKSAFPSDIDKLEKKRVDDEVELAVCLDRIKTLREYWQTQPYVDPAFPPNSDSEDIPDDLLHLESENAGIKTFIWSMFKEILHAEGFKRVSEIQRQWDCNEEFQDVKKMYKNSGNVCDILLESNNFFIVEDILCLQSQLPDVYFNVKTKTLETLSCNYTALFKRKVDSSKNVDKSSDPFRFLPPLNDPQTSTSRINPPRDDQSRFPPLKEAHSNSNHHKNTPHQRGLASSMHLNESVIFDSNSQNQNKSSTDVGQSLKAVSTSVLKSHQEDLIHQDSQAESTQPNDISVLLNAISKATEHLPVNNLSNTESELEETIRAINSKPQDESPASKSRMHKTTGTGNPGSAAVESNPLREFSSNLVASISQMYQEAIAHPSSTPHSSSSDQDLESALGTKSSQMQNCNQPFSKSTLVPTINSLPLEIAPMKVTESISNFENSGHLNPTCETVDKTGHKFDKLKKPPFESAVNTCTESEMSVKPASAKTGSNNVEEKPACTEDEIERSANSFTGSFDGPSSKPDITDENEEYYDCDLSEKEQNELVGEEGHPMYDKINIEDAASASLMTHDLPNHLENTAYNQNLTNVEKKSADLLEMEVVQVCNGLSVGEIFNEVERVQSFIREFDKTSEFDMKTLNALVNSFLSKFSGKELERLNAESDSVVGFKRKVKLCLDLSKKVTQILSNRCSDMMTTIHSFGGAFIKRYNVLAENLELEISNWDRLPCKIPSGCFVGRLPSFENQEFGKRKNIEVSDGGDSYSSFTPAAKMEGFSNTVENEADERNLLLHHVKTQNEMTLEFCKKFHTFMPPMISENFEDMEAANKNFERTSADQANLLSLNTALITSLCAAFSDNVSKFERTIHTALEELKNNQIHFIFNLLRSRYEEKIADYEGFSKKFCTNSSRNLGCWPEILSNIEHSRKMLHQLDYKERVFKLKYAKLKTKISEAGTISAEDVKDLLELDFEQDPEFKLKVSTIEEVFVSLLKAAANEFQKQNQQVLIKAKLLILQAKDANMISPDLAAQMLMQQSGSQKPEQPISSSLAGEKGNLERSSFSESNCSSLPSRSNSMDSVAQSTEVADIEEKPDKTVQHIPHSHSPVHLPSVIAPKKYDSSNESDGRQTSSAAACANNFENNQLGNLNAPGSSCAGAESKEIETLVAGQCSNPHNYSNPFEIGATTKYQPEKGICPYIETNVKPAYLFENQTTVKCQTEKTIVATKPEPISTAFDKSLDTSSVTVPENRAFAGHDKNHSKTQSIEVKNPEKHSETKNAQPLSPSSIKRKVLEDAVKQSILQSSIKDLSRLIGNSLKQSVNPVSSSSNQVPPKPVPVAPPKALPVDQPKPLPIPPSKTVPAPPSKPPPVAAPSTPSKAAAQPVNSRKQHPNPVPLNSPHFQVPAFPPPSPQKRKGSISVEQPRNLAPQAVNVVPPGENKCLSKPSTSTQRGASAVQPKAVTKKPGNSNENMSHQTNPVQPKSSSKPPTKPNETATTSGVAYPSNAPPVASKVNQPKKSVDTTSKTPGPSTSKIESKFFATLKDSCFKKLMFKLKEKYPNKSEVDLILYVKSVRERNRDSLTGMSFLEIMALVDSMVETPNFKFPKLSGESSASPKPSITVMGLEKFGQSAWVKNETPDNSNYSNEDLKECVVCCSMMARHTTTTLPCKHVFHTHCIREWLRIKCVCPLCQAFCRMPDEYPSLR